MYSKLQQQCLQEIGIQGYELNEQYTDINEVTAEEPALPEDSTSEFLNWQQAPEKLINDLKKIFPQLHIKGINLHLTEQLTWLSSQRETEVRLENGQLITPSFLDLQQATKVEIWRLIKPLAPKG